jgi:predicted ATPase
MAGTTSRRSPSADLVELVAGLSSVRMSDYSVVGAYMRFGEAVRERLKDARLRIADACAKPAKRRDNHLLWAAPGSGKTYFVEQVAASLDDVGYKELNLAKLSEEEFRTGLGEVVSAGPTICLVDEVDAKPDEPWPYEALMPYLDVNLERGGGIVFVLAGSSGGTIGEFRDRIRGRPKGADVLSRVPDANAWEISPMDAGDRILVALSQMLSAATELDRRLTEVEKLALYYVASAEHLSNARQLREFAVRAVARGSQSNDRIRYDDLFDSGDSENKRFWVGAMPAAQALENSFIHIRTHEPAPPTAAPSRQSGLPAPANPIVGRERELADVVRLIADGARLVTLTGPGGSGKTRLALEAASSLADQYEDGVAWVGLTALRDPALVTETMAQALGAKDGLLEYVRERELLVVLDNFEHLIAAAAEVARLLRASPKLRLLVTSRELLRIGGEVEYPVPPLVEPAAVELFCSRSRLEPDATIAELCRSLDALPLALELAAARTSVLSPKQILERLGERLDLLKGGRDAESRQQTLRATIEWSYELLDEREQRLLSRLAVFRGGCTLELAEAVADADVDTLQSLVDKNLVRHTGERFWMLELIRTFGRERLSASSEEDDLRRRHASAMQGLFDAARRELSEGRDHATVYARVVVEHDNLRTALEWSHERGEDALLASLASHLAWFFGPRGHRAEARVWLERALERRSAAPPPVRMRLLSSASAQLAAIGDYPRSDALVTEWLELAREVGDEDEALGAMNSAALNAAEQGELDRARAQFTELKTRAEEIGNREIVAFAMVNLGDVEARARDFRTSLEYCAAAVELFRHRGDDGGVVMSLLGCGWASLGLLDAPAAERFFRETLPMAARIGWIGGVAQASDGLGAALIERGDIVTGLQFMGAATKAWTDHGLSNHDELPVELRARATEKAKASLGDEAFTAALASGEALTVDEIVALAASSIGGPPAG